MFCISDMGIKICGSPMNVYMPGGIDQANDINNQDNNYYSRIKEESMFNNETTVEARAAPYCLLSYI